MIKCKINNVLKKCISKGYDINTAQRYLRMYCKINLSDEVLVKRCKLLKK